jgi:hypothetical protein
MVRSEQSPRLARLDARIGCLPVWARRYIEGLERRIDGGGKLDLRPGAVNTIMPTRKEMAASQLVLEGEVARDLERIRRAL